MSRSTADPVPQNQLGSDVAAVMDTIAEEGVAIVPLDVAYAIVAATPAGVRRIFDAKERSYEKPCGMFGSSQLSRAIHVMEEEKHAMVRFLAEEARLPFSVVAPFRPDHPLLSGADPFVLQSSSKAGTLDMLINAGQFHDEIARQSDARTMGVFGSSANTSLTGSKYRLNDIDAPVLAAADISFDYGVSKYDNDQGYSSSIIDFETFNVLRIGHEFDELQRVFQTEFDVTLTVA